MSDVDEVLAMLGDLPPIVQAVGGPGCFHRRTIVDPRARRVSCRDCGADLDPITVLADLARAGDRFERTARAEREAAARLEELLRRERNARARVRRLER